MKRIILLVCMLIITSSLISATVMAQEKQETKFIHAENWNDVLQKAKETNKIIFIDAFTTWCGPCKKMDMDVFPDSMIGIYLNENFLPVKIQFDVTERDSEDIKKWRIDAKYLMKAYNVEAFPTFLFIAPDGKLVHKGTGYQDKDMFLKLLKTANNPKVNFSGLVAQFKSGILPNNDLLELSLETKENGQDTLALEMAKDFKTKVLDNFDAAILSKRNLINFISTFKNLFYFDDKMVGYLYKNPSTADSLLRSKGSSQLITNYMITKDLINPIIKPNGKYISAEPDWQMLEQLVAKKSDLSTAGNLISNSKISWYNDKKDWNGFIKHTIERYDRYGLDTIGMGSMGINNFVYSKVFKYSKDTAILKKACEYMKTLLKNNPNNPAWIDTYANLLYKMGKKKEALKLEAQATEIAQKANDYPRMETFKEILRKMQNNEVTW